MSGFKHKNDKPKLLKKGFAPYVEIEEMVQYVDSETVMNIIAASGVPAKLIPRAGVSRYDSDFPHKAFGFIRTRPHPAKQKTHQLEAGRRMNEFIRKHERPAKKQHWKLPRKSLHWLALELGKTSRQVRRYCELGFIPGAYRTKGGHWRVSCGRRTLVSVRRKIRDFTRTSWTHGERRGFRERAKTEIILHGINLAKELHEMSGLAPKRAMAAAEKDENRTRLILAVKKLFLENLPLTKKEIASQLRISRASLYRCFSTEEMSVAIAAVRPEPTMPVASVGYSDSGERISVTDAQDFNENDKTDGENEEYD